MMPDVATAIVNVIIGNIIDEIDTSVNKITNKRKLFSNSGMPLESGCTDAIPVEHKIFDIRSSQFQTFTLLMEYLLRFWPDCIEQLYHMHCVQLFMFVCSQCVWTGRGNTEFGIKIVYIISFWKFRTI